MIFGPVVMKWERDKEHVLLSIYPLKLGLGTVIYTGCKIDFFNAFFFLSLFMTS